jgi:3-oxoacyl-[acyl-carrier protein] reductase
MKKSLGVLVIGGSGEIGSEICRDLVRLGYEVGIHYVRNRRKVDQLKKEIQHHGRCGLFASKLRNENEAKKLIKKYLSFCRKPFGIVLAGGTVPFEHWKHLHEVSWLKVFRQHCMLPFYLIRAIAPFLPKHGRVIYLSSISPKYGGSEKTLHYACAKSAGETAILGLARQFKKKSILFNTVRVGFVETKTQLNKRTSKERKQRASKIYLGRPGSPQEASYVVSSLFHPRASFVANTKITVAGGD